MKAKVNRLLNTISILSFIIISEIIVRVFFGSNNIFIPPPSVVFESIIINFSQHFSNVLSTISIILAGLIPAILIGWILAIVIYEYSKIGNFLKPIIDSTQLIPKTALIPIFLVFSFLGYTWKSKVLIIFLISFYPVFIDTLLGLRHINEYYLLYFKSINASRIDSLRYLKIPFSKHHLINGIKTSILYSVVGAVTGEMLIGMEGVGYSIAYSAEKLNFVMAYSGIIMCILIGVALLCIFKFILSTIHFIHNNQKSHERKKILKCII